MLLSIFHSFFNFIQFFVFVFHRFLLQCLEDLDSSLRKIDSRLYVLRGQPNDVFPKIFDEWGNFENFFNSIQTEEYLQCQLLYFLQTNEKN